MSRPQRFDAAGRVAYLDAVTASDFGRDYKPITLELLDARPGDVVLDLGCGNGDDARVLAERVGAEGRVLGVDSDTAVLGVAARRASQLEHSNLCVARADGFALPACDNTFDRARADRVFQMVGDRAGLLREMIRTTRPGGTIVVSNPGGGSALDIGDRELANKISTAFLSSSGDGWSGTELPNLMKECGLADVIARPYTHWWSNADASDAVTPMERVVAAVRASGLVSEEEGRRFLERLADAQRNDRFTFVHTIMIVRGTVQE